MKSKKNTVIRGVDPDKLERAHDKILEWFFAFPEKEVSLNDVAEKLQIAKTTANVIITQLVKDGFLTVSILGKLWRIKANQQHIWFTKRKIPFNLQLVYESGIISWVEREMQDAKTIILFGSYRKGDDMESSDIDIAVEVTSEQDLDIWKAVIPKLSYRTNVNVNIHRFSRKKIDINLFANIANGIILKGFLEVRP